MFVREQKVRSGDATYRYLKVVESQRENGRIVQRTLVNLGNVTQWPQGRLEEVIRLLSRFLGLDLSELSQIRFSECRQLGPYLALSQLWADLGMDAIIERAVAHRKIDMAVWDYAQVMAFNRLVSPSSKRAVWEKAGRDMQIPGVSAQSLPLHGYYRALEYLSQAKRPIEQALHGRVKDLFNQDLSLVFYDLTSTYFEGTACAKAKRGYSRDHRPDLMQIEIGLLVDQEGIPIGHEVFDGNVGEVCTVLLALERLKREFGVRRCIFVGDDGMASEGNLKQIEACGYEYITSLALGNSKVGAELLFTLPSKKSFEQVCANMWLMPLRSEGGVRYIAAYNPLRSATNRSHRKARIRACLEYLRHLNKPPKGRGRRLKPVEAEKAADRFLRQKRCHELIQVERLPEGGFGWRLNRAALRTAARRDGMMVLQTNSRTLSDLEVATGYRTLWRVENAFRHIKDVIGLRPIRHWADPRVLGHVFICVLAYTLERLLDRRLEQAGLDLTARAALDELNSITVATLELGDQRLRRRSNMTARQKQILAAAGVQDVPELW
jgi:transposase